MIGHVIRTPHQGSRRRKKRRGSSRRVYRLREFVLAYGCACVVNITCLLLVLPAIVFVYPGTGIVLSRYVGRRVVWWEYRANIKNISSVKLHFIVSWPISMPVFIWQIFVVKFL